VLFGGDCSGEQSPLTDTWMFNGSWQEVFPQPSPPADEDGAMAYDWDLKSLVLTSAGPYTWLWNGTYWHSDRSAPTLTPSTPPIGSTMQWDSSDGELVLFGGAPDGGHLTNQTWVFQRSKWTEEQPATSPPPLAWPSSSYQRADGGVVLFGGDGSHGFADLTWLWNGTTWTQLNPALSPPAIGQAQMAVAPKGDRLVLFGGWTTSSSGAGERSSETWGFTPAVS